MAEDRWLTIIGLGEDGPEGLSAASRKALEDAEVVMGAARHLSLVPDAGGEHVTWPVPFSYGLSLLRSFCPRSVAVLASGDPFWFGAGAAIAREFEANEWHAFPGTSTFSLAAARLGWSLETTSCLGLHAAPLERLRARLVPGQQALVLLRDGEAVGELAAWLSGAGFGDTTLHVCEALGGPRERIRAAQANDYDLCGVLHPVCVGLEFQGAGAILTRATGQADGIFDNDGQITKRPIRAVTLSTLAPKPGELLWDIGAGSGSVALEWLMCHPAMQAVAVEVRDDRAARIRANASALGQDRLEVVTGAAPGVLAKLPTPQAVFVGGGLDAELLGWLEENFAPGTRLVANSVTLDTETILTEAQARLGGTLTKIEISEAAPLGRFRGWKAGYPVVQWSVTL